MDSIISSSVENRRFSMILLSIFAALALLLSSLGIYGVISYLVGQQTREIGIRLALGELPNRILGSFLTETSRLLVLGAALGIPSSLLLAHAARALLYGITPGNIATQAIALAILTTIALAASFLPARRASRINPTEALRSE